jgi:hypothetical protein
MKESLTRSNGRLSAIKFSHADITSHSQARLERVFGGTHDRRIQTPERVEASRY